MKKNYFFTLIFALTLLISFQGFSQSSVNTTFVQQNIKELSIYPNPVTNGKTFIYITSKRNLTKKVEFFNVLGKQIFSIVLTGKELNISNLSKGVYILKVTENNVSETRKLIIK
ncbi:T9SS type A sorting domain-containing protein [Thalassobellus suaedae]|uniref:T9SS type A sorting domain-containing protein n=1 Tax=Thalassobellus suaedae TaxID=3074124 RepID=A0ABY9Y5Y6_9FLAO|nr:T9SS type A sorting domain-containing protein [Flavobacteriaceae bacterium HL-DH10]